MTVTYQDQQGGREYQFAASVGDSLLEVALRNGLIIEHTCGGVGACATCHVKVIKGGEFLSPATENEFDQLEQAPGVDLHSRLACQSRIIRSGPILCIIPAWNRNQIREATP